MKIHFGPLLAAGKSLVNGEVAGRYRMRENLRLPQFISPKNPFAVEAAAKKTASPSATPERRENASAGAQLNPKPSFRVRLGGGLMRATLWCLDHNPLSSIGRPRLPSLPRFGKPHVQEELSLDRVQVLRGDVAHADLEVMRPESESNRATTAAWRSLTARVFGGESR
jgi:hypothetical protein